MSETKRQKLFLINTIEYELVQIIFSYTWDFKLMCIVLPEEIHTI